MKEKQCKQCCRENDLMPIFGDRSDVRICKRYNKRIDEVRTCDIYESKKESIQRFVSSEAIA